jgi:hypothetical protein
MKANELRIGQNYKHSNGTIIKLDLRFFYAMTNNFDGYKLDDLQPIPLTEDILLKCGFECFEFDNGQPNQYRFKSRLIVIRDNVFVDYGSSVKILYIHQLQNLYFALTGEELNIIL